MSPVPYQTKTQLILPVKGGVLVWDGHDYQSHHRRFDYTRGAFLRLGIKTNSQRYAYDFVVVDDQGLMHRAEQSAGDEWYPGKSDTNEAYYGFSVPIHAAGTGRVAAIHDGEPDNRSFNQAELATRETARGGNYVVVDHLNGEFSWFGHLKQGSISVKIGQQVKQGEVIARMGASGDSLFPQLAALPFSLSPWVCTSETDGFAPRCRRSSPARCPTSSLSFSGKTTPENADFMCCPSRTLYSLQIFETAYTNDRETCRRAEHMFRQSSDDLYTRSSCRRPSRLRQPRQF